MLTYEIGEVSMTTTQTTDIEAGAQATSQPVAGNQPGKKGDYTKYFYRNIQDLWVAVHLLQAENATLRSQLKTASASQNGGV
jgi:hypothetical protein